VVSGGEDIVAKYLILRDQQKRLLLKPMPQTGSSFNLEIDDLEKQQEALAGSVEKIINQHIRETLEDQGIYQPWYKYIG